MKVYQLVAYGELGVLNGRHTIYSKKLYRSDGQAQAAILEFSKLVTTPKDEHDLMVLDKKGLRILINSLELVNNKKEKKND